MVTISNANIESSEAVKLKEDGRVNPSVNEK
jgi:hypothetical protein